MSFRSTITILSLGMALTIPANDLHGHHSRVNFDLGSVIELEGTVTRWQYRNPHVFLHMDVVNEVGGTERWVVELGSIVNLKQIDMHRDTLKPGDKVHIVANPEKKPKNNYAFFKSLTTENSTEYKFSDVFAYSRNAAAKEGQKGSTDFVPSDYGHSIGRMDGDDLVVDTIGFVPAKWGIGDGLDSSEQKRVVERYVLADDGQTLHITYTVTDPVYLAAPFSRTHTKRYVPGYVITPYEACDPDTARLHLEIEQN